jgi:hypothetical protein
MTWLWRICFSILGTLPALGAVLTGSVRLVESADQGVRKRADFSGVVVWLEPLSGNQRAASASNVPRATVVQKDKRFIPHVLAIRTGAIVDFPNYDPIFHNAFSSFSGQIFDVGLYPPHDERRDRGARHAVVRRFGPFRRF